MRRKITGLLAMTLLLYPGAADSNWEIEDLSGKTLGEEAETVLVVNLSTTESNGNDPLTPTVLGDDARLQYYYNASDSADQLRNLYSSYYFADISPDKEIGKYVRYEASGSATNNIENSVEEANTTTRYSVGNLTPVVVTNVSRDFEPGEEATFEVYIRNGTDGNVTGSEGEVHLNLTDFRENETRTYTMNYDSSRELYEVRTVDVFDRFDSLFYLEVGVRSPVTGEEGEASTIIQTSALNGTLEEVEAERCESAVNPETCQPGSDLNLSLDFSDSPQPDKVNGSFTAQTPGESIELGNLSLNTSDGQTYNTSLTVPEINTSAGDVTIEVQIRAHKNRKIQRFAYEFAYENFIIDNAGSPQTSTGSYDIRLAIKRPFTTQTLPPENTTGNLTVLDPNGSETASPDLEDFSYSSETGIYSENIGVEGLGVYDIEVQAEDRFGSIEREEFSFSSTESQQSFQLSGEETYMRNKTGDVNFSFEAENLIDQPLKLSFNTSGELSENISVEDGENLTLESGEDSEVDFQASGSTLYNGSATVQGEGNRSGYSTNLTLNITQPVCGTRTDNLCHNASDLLEEVDSGDEQTLDLVYVGEFGSETDYEFGLEGNISQALTAEPENTTLSGDFTNDSVELELNYSTQVPGFYQGNLTSDSGDGETVQAELGTEVNVENPPLSFTVSKVGIDLGFVPEGGSSSSNVDIDNTGGVDLTEVSAVSQEFDVEAGTINIGPGESQTLTLTFPQISSESGTVTLEIGDGSRTETYELDVTATTIEDIPARADELITEAEDLEGSSQGFEDRLGTVRTDLREAKNRYNSGEYRQAKQLFDSAETELESIRTDIQTQESQETEEDSPTQPEPEQSSSDQGSGTLFLAAGFIILILLVGGFVVATSVELEPGDPLYDVVNG